MSFLHIRRRPRQAQ
uniref:Uncharacterized protein n=1 Tax=Anguilla anguilla TaxID=7936 RepID=A0A0E9RKE2_ANGAN